MAMKSPSVVKRRGKGSSRPVTLCVGVCILVSKVIPIAACSTLPCVLDVSYDAVVDLISTVKA